MRYLFVIIVALFLSSALNAQIHANLNFNLGSQPIWGPTGNDYVENYYLPDIEVYYNVAAHGYYYNERERWISSINLPTRYHNFDLYNAHKIVINEKQPRSEEHTSELQS